MAAAQHVEDPVVIEIPTKPEDDVLVDRPPPKQRNTKSRDPRIISAIDTFCTYKPGQSFFVPDAKAADLQFLRRPFIRAGLNMIIREVERDEIYGVPGVRVWRLAGEYDEL